MNLMILMLMMSTLTSMTIDQDIDDDTDDDTDDDSDHRKDSYTVAGAVPDAGAAPVQNRPDHTRPKHTGC